MTLGLRGRGSGRLLLLASLAGCTGVEPEPQAEATTGDASSVADGSSTATGDASTTDASGSPTTASTSGTGTDESTTADTMPPDMGTMPPPLKLCSLAVIDPAADPAAVIDAGDGAGQIPTRVGEALLRNCGCHYTDDVPIGLYVDYVSNNQPLATLADFHGSFMGTFPMGFEDQPTYVAVEERVVHHNPLPMPPFGCGVEGEPGMISAADLQLLTDWLAAAAPDGASFP